MARLIFIYLLIACDCIADTYTTGMIGVFNSGKHSYSESKFLNFGTRNYLGFGLSYQLEFGGWTDIAGHGRKGSFYGASMLGVETDGIVMGRAMVGPAFITNPDAYLGGIFPQFSEEVFFGVRGQNRNAVGFKYKHISSGGLVMPNNGRDFFGIEMSIPW